MLEQRIADIAAHLWKNAITHPEQHLLKRNLIDSFAGICASLADKNMLATMGNYAAMAPDAEGVSVWGTGRRAQPMQAVFLNTILGRRSDLVNTYLSPNHMGGNHPSDNVSLLLTLADWKGLSGKNLLRAMNAAYALSCAFSDYYNLEAAGFDHDAAAPLYTALTAGLLEGLDGPGLVEAQRIAGAMGLNPDQTGVGLVTDWKHCTYASCAMRGVEAALMAKAGFKGPVDIYQGEAGWDRFVPHAGEFMTDPPDLGRIVFKSWQALVFCQTAIDVAAGLSADFLANGWREVKSVRVETYEKALREAGGESSRQPVSRAGRTHSLAYCVLAALLGGGVDYDSFGDAVAGDERMQGLMDKVVLLADEEMTAAFPEQAPCRVTVEYQGREPLSAFRARPHGDPADPLSDDDISAKALRHLSELIPEEAAKELIQRLWAVDREPELAFVLAPLTQGAESA